MVDITKEDDFTAAAGIDRAIQNIKGPRDSLFFSSPCTGGSPWQRINLLRGGDRMLVRLKGHWKLFKQLRASFEKVAIHAMSVGARIFVEWPRGCAYWNDKRVSGFLTKYGFSFADFDGCMYGLIAAYGSTQGMPIRKPWRIAC